MEENSIDLHPRRVAQLKRVLNGEPIGEASKAVGYSSKSTGSRALSDTRKRLLAAMDHYKLTPETYVRDYLLPLLNATTTLTASYEGQITDTMEVADNSTRMAAIRETAKMMQLYPREQSDGPATLNIQINNTIDTNGDRDE
jgi:hypothetical protein